ncbi:hypothetical protein A0H81_11369 [Grifola frondosa]|uniref:Cytochrome P450 67 n=1 Tax=Grifola frondosa TaxID=5627 RepID=A0A1C7LW78_GRIFR|nr:hypothetical protein A0H81_11369 [Grifola frondosa]
MLSELDGSAIPTDIPCGIILVLCLAALSAHFVFKRYETYNIAIHAGLLFLPPAGCAVLFLNQYRPIDAILISFGTYLSVLVSSILMYRISPFHPLAQYPGPLLNKLSKFRLACVAGSGRQYLYIQKLHERYGDIVRIGPNEVSIRDVSAILPLMGTKGYRRVLVYWIGRNISPNVNYLVAISDQREHARRRKPWIRAFSPAALKGYEEITVKRVAQLVNALASKSDDPDLGKWFSYFTFDVMNDLAYGGGSEMMRDGDTGGSGTCTSLTAHSSSVISLHKFPGSVKEMDKLRTIKRIRDGSLAHDVFYYLNNEDGVESSPPSLDALICDGNLVIIAGADTTSSVLTNLFFCLLTNRDAYDRLQSEVDTHYPPGEDALDTKYHADMPFLNAVINETLRLYPATPDGSQRIAEKGSGGRMIGPYFLPENTSASVHFYSVHRDPRNFSPFTNSFWPDRWLIAAGEDTCAHQITRKNCVGKNLALQELRMVVCLAMQKLDMRLSPGWDPKSYEEDEVFWNEDPKALQDSEWAKLSSDFTNRRLTAGKESALQQGFDEGFADVDGHELGQEDLLREARDIVSQLSNVRFSDIAPPDLEAQRHAREHLESVMEDDNEGMDFEVPEEVAEKRKMEKLEDMIAQMGAGSGGVERQQQDRVWPTPFLAQAAIGCKGATYAVFLCMSPVTLIFTTASAEDVHDG